MRARLAFDELTRLGGFDRLVLVIAMPTGSGWFDLGGMDALDYITRGNVATVSVQYSYLPSPVSVVVDPMQSVACARPVAADAVDPGRHPVPGGAGHGRRTGHARLRA